MPRYSSVPTDVESNFPAPSSPALIHEGPPVQPVAEHPEPQLPVTEPEQQSKRPSSERRKSKKLTKKPPLGRELPPENPSFKGPTDLEADNIDNTVTNDWPLSEPLPQEPEPIRPSARSRSRASYHHQPRSPANKWDPSRHSLHNPTYNYNYNYSITPPEVDNFEDVANGKLATTAMATANDNVHDRGVEGLRINTSYDAHDVEQSEPSASDPLVVEERRNSATQLDRLMSPAHSANRLSVHSNTTRNSLMPLTQDSASMGVASPTPSRSPSVSYLQNDSYSEAPNHRYSRNLDPSLITFDRFDPDSIEDDGDYGLHYPAQSRSKRASILSFHSNRGSAVSLSPSRAGGPTPPKSARASTENHGVYTAPSEGGVEGAEGVQTTGYTGLENYDQEKQAWEKQEVRHNKRKMWILAIIIFILVVGGGVGGIVGEYYVKKG